MQGMTGPIKSAAASYPATPGHPALARIDLLFKEFKEIPDSNVPQVKEENRQKKLDKLHEAYALCLNQTGDPTIMARLSMILGEFGIMLYGQEPKYPGKVFPEEAEFTISKQILLGALQAFLVRIGADEVQCDFSTHKDLKQMPATILDHKPFAAVEPGFIKADKNALMELARGARLSDLEGLHSSRMLRYLNGAARYIRGAYEKRDMNEQDKRLTLNTIYLARDFARCDENEFWEVMYNDWADTLVADGTWNEETKLKHIQWLQNSAKNDSQIARVCNKFLRDVNGTRQSLGKCLEILQRKMAPQDYQMLNDVLSGKMLDEVQIGTLVKKLFTLDLTDKDHLTISWFAIIPSNLASRLMDADSANFREIEGLLRLSGAIVDAERRAGEHHVNYKAIDENWAKYYLYLKEPIRLATTSVRGVGTTLRNVMQTPALPKEEALKMLREANATALLAKPAFQQYFAQPDQPALVPPHADRIVKERIEQVDKFLGMITEWTEKLQKTPQA